MNIHPTAIIHPEARIADNVTIGPYSVISEDVQIDEGTWIGNHVSILPGSRIGKDCRIYHSTSIGEIPQDLKFKGEKTTLEIGERTVIREFVTLNRGTEARGRTFIGSDCLIMAYAHVAHDCLIGHHVILANADNLAGHVTIQDYAILGGMVPVHQFVTIGQHSFIGGGYRVTKDIPPYILASGDPMRYAGLNSIGLRRRGFSEETISKIKKTYRTIYRRGLNVSQALAELEKSDNLIPEVKNIINFIRKSERGII